MKRTALLMVLVVALVFGAVGYAFAAGSATFTGSSPVDNSTNLVQVQAKVNPKISLTINTPDGSGSSLLVDFGSVDPGVTTSGKTVSLDVASNKNFTIATAITDPAPLNLATSINPATVYTHGNTQTISDPYSITPDFSLLADGSTYSATVQYTVTQQ